MHLPIARPSFLRRAVVAGVLVTTTGCSAFVPHTQRVTVVAWSAEAAIKIDGVPVGTGEVRADVARNKAHVFSAALGPRTETIVVDKHISVTGVLDTIGTIFFLVPIIGTFTPGYYDLDRTAVALPPEPAVVRHGVVRGSFSR